MSPIQQMYENILKNVGELFQTLRSPKTWLNFIINSFKKKG